MTDKPRIRFYRLFGGDWSAYASHRSQWGWGRATTQILAVEKAITELRKQEPT